MSGPFGRPTDHDRARELAAWRMDGLLEPAEEAWLDEHLGECDACAAAAGEYATDRLLLQGLRDAVPEPPRDLWARTAAAIEATGSGRPVQVAQVSAAGSGRLGWVLAPVAGLAIVTVAVGVGLLNGQPALSPGLAEAEPTPMAVAANIRVVGQGEDGQLEIRTRNVREVCPIGSDACSVAPAATTEPLAAMAQAPIVSEAILSPTRDRLVIVQGDEAGQGIYVVPVATAAAAGPAGSPTVATAVTPAPAATSTPAQTTAPPTPDTTVLAASPATGSPEASGTPAATLGSTPAPEGTPGPAASTSPAPATSSSPDPGVPTPPVATTGPETTPPVATTGPEPTPAPASDAPATPEPSPSVEVTPGPGGAVEIASDVVVVGPMAAYNRSGSRFAFTARPADGSAGPDVYVWNTSESRAEAITSDHRSVFSGWHAGDLVVSRVGQRDSRTWLVDPVTGAETGPVSEGWLPTISPDRRNAVWWEGDVRFAGDGVTAVTGAGRLVLGPWEAEGAVQQLAEGPIRGWSVAWDPSGSVLAVWEAGPSPRKPGSLSLYRVAADGRTVDLENPIREDLPAFEGFVLDTDHLAWPATSDDGKPVVRVLAWNDDGVGVVELASEDGGTIVR